MPAPSGGFNRFRQIGESLRPAVGRVIRVATMNIQARAVASMEEPKTGRVYHVPGLAGTRFHTASAPGEAPAVLFGTLHTSVQSSFPRETLGVIWTPDEKAPYLEYGTSRMAARPWLTPAAVAEKDDFGVAMRAAIGGVR